MTGLKMYFAVDTQYVLKKLMLLLFPYTHRDWSPKYQSEQPIPAREDINAPDLYIPGESHFCSLHVCWGGGGGGGGGVEKGVKYKYWLRM